MFVQSLYGIIILLTAFIFFAGVNVPVVNGAAVDIFPTYLRSMAISISMMFGRLGTTISTNVLAVSLEKNCELSFYVFSGICAICLLVSLILPHPKK